MRIGLIIKNYRDEHNISIRSFAKSADISPSYVSKLELDTDNTLTLTMPKLESIAKALGITFDKLNATMNDTVDTKTSAECIDPQWGDDEANKALISLERPDLLPLYAEVTQSDTVKILFKRKNPDRPLQPDEVLKTLEAFDSLPKEIGWDE